MMEYVWQSPAWRNYPRTEVPEELEGTMEETREAVEEDEVTTRVRKVAQGRVTRWKVQCSDCGDIAHRNSHKAATEAKVWHMIEKHGQVVR